MDIHCVHSDYLWKFSDYLNRHPVLPHLDPRYARCTFAYMFNTKTSDELIVHRVSKEQRIGFMHPVTKCDLRDDHYRFVFIASGQFNKRNILTESTVIPLMEDNIYYRDPVAFRRLPVEFDLLSIIEDFNLPLNNVAFLSEYRERRKVG